VADTLKTFFSPALVRRLAAGRWVPIARPLAVVFAALIVAGAGATHEDATRGALPMLLILVPGVVAAAALVIAARPALAVDAVAAPVLALALVTLSCTRTAQGLEARASFQRPEMMRARATFAQAVEPGAVVITTEDVGRPGENIDYYSHVAHALYLTDLERWRMSVADAAELLARGGMKPYLLIPTSQPGRAKMLDELQKRFSVELAADIPAPKAMDHFVAAAFYPRGIHMELFRLRWQGVSEHPVP